MKNGIFFNSFELYSKIDIFFIILYVKRFVFIWTLVKIYFNELKLFFVRILSNGATSICIIFSFFVHLTDCLLETINSILGERNTPFFEMSQKPLFMKRLPSTFQLFCSFYDLTIEHFLDLRVLLQ